MEYFNENDSLLFSTLKQPYPMPLQYNDSIFSLTPGGIEEGFSMLTKGDSVSFKVSADSLFKNTFRAPMPPDIKAGSLIRFEIGVVDVVTEEEYREMQLEAFRKEQEKAAKEAEELLKSDIEIIEKFLKENNLEAQSTESGLRYVITEEGSGPKPEKGDKVSVLYSGALLDGTAFDANQDREKPFQFVIGVGQVIPGWDEGIALLNKGSKAKIFIPSPLAYGPRQRGEVIKPNSILVFEVELLDVEKK
ncbi:FKBP-type peptidyl-prolyl cis-trans isomerase [Cytophagales bacterium RKSG123]|nr:FKBP-type peptidyl-prolyl cis-trans isomerase [Xanthovirga aplysinae]